MLSCLKEHFHVGTFYSITLELCSYSDFKYRNKYDNLLIGTPLGVYFKHLFDHWKTLRSPYVKIE